MSILKKLAIIAGVVATLPPLLYELYSCGEAGSEMMFNATTGMLPPPPKHLPPQFLKRYLLYGSVAQHRERQILGMRKEFQEYYNNIEGLTQLGVKLVHHQYTKLAVKVFDRVYQLSRIQGREIPDYLKN